MARVNVTELLVDNDFVDAVTLIHRTPNVNSYGENVLAEKCVSTVGSVQPASGRTLMRAPDALKLEDVSSFWVKGEIVSDGTCKYPDILVFKNRRYQVKSVQNWTNFGAGWCEGLCIAEKTS